MSLRNLAIALAGLLSVVGLAACTPEAPVLDDGEPRAVADHAAWTWFNDERAVVVGDDLFVGYVDTSGHSGVTVLPLDGGEPVSRQISSFTQADDHNNPAFVALPGGRVLAAYAMHHDEPYWYWRVGDMRGDSVTWTSERRTQNLGAPVTYSNLFRLEDEGGRIYNFFRGTNFNPTLMTSDAFRSSPPLLCCSS